MSRGPHPYPLFLDVSGRPALVVGGGPVAERRAATLLESGARVTLIAPAATAALRAAAGESRLRWLPRAFLAEDISGHVLVFAATGIAEVDATVSSAARERGAFVNVADDAARSDFHVPAIERRGPIQIAVGTGGAAPGLAARLRDRFAASLGPEWERFARLLGEMRSLARRTVPDQRARMRAIARAAHDDELLAAVARGTAPSAEAALKAAIGGGTPPASDTPAGAGAFVSIVGAGPGDPGLMTVAGRERLRAADVVVYDDLVDRRLLLEARASAELVYAGKRGWRDDGERPGPEILARMAREGGGRRVVRLKGGDPSVFGRLEEELGAVRTAGVAHEVIPGVTAALAAAAAAGIPLTQRGKARSVTFATGIATAENPGDARAADIAHLIGSGGTVAVYMGLRALPDIGAALIAHGVMPELPAAIIGGASTPDQTVVISTVARIAEAAEKAGIASPALVIIGEVAGPATGGPASAAQELRIADAE